MDLFNFLLGNIKFIARGGPSFDFHKLDPTYPLLMKSGKVNINVNIGNAKDYYLFNLKFIFSKKIIEVSEMKKK